MTKPEWDLISLQLKQLIEGQTQIISRQAHVIERLDHLDDCIDGAKLSIQDLKNMVEGAVPNGDLASHKQTHVDMIADKEKWDEIKIGSVKKAAEWATVGMLVLVVTAIWQYLQRGL